jgi:hypothetical protein
VTETLDIPIVAAPAIKPIREIKTMDDYLRNYGRILGRKAIHALDPLHVPGRDELPDFEDLRREPFPAQQHVVAAAVKMMDTVGSGFICGEMGTGKTILGMSAVYKHAQRSRRQGGSNGNFRCIVLCPDHLISKWEREIEETIPGARVFRFGPRKDATGKTVMDWEGKVATPMKDSVRLLQKCYDGTKEIQGNEQTSAPKEYSVSTGVAEFIDTKTEVPESSGKAAQRCLRWAKPEGAEYYVLGRNQAKWLSDWAGLADPHRDLRGHMCANALSSKHVIVEKTPILNEFGRHTYDAHGREAFQNVTARVFYCPSCGTVLKDKKGVPLSEKELQKKTRNATQKTCLGRYLQQLPGDRKNMHGLDRICPVPDRYEDKQVGNEFVVGGHKYVVKECKEPLFHYTSKPFRWAPSRFIQKKLRGMFKYLIIDEVHEQKSDESGQSMAAGKLMASVKHTIALTGTIIGGYANHLYPLMIRMTPRTLRDEGFEWGKDMAFSEAYGRIDRIITTKEDAGEASVSGQSKSMRKARTGKASERKAVRPGVMPTMFGRHMIGSSMFITLDQMSDGLPALHEYIGGRQPEGMEPDPFWFDTAIDMEPDQAAEYRRVTGALESANKDLLQRGSMKLLGAYLWTALDYPDRPWGWGHDPEVIKAFEEAKAETELETGPEGVAGMSLPHTIGYWFKKGSKRLDNWVGVVTPKDCDQEVIYPKEQKLIDICKAQNAEGTQTWVYVQMSGKRNIQPRLKMLLEREGLRVGVLRSKDVDPKEREDWIIQNGRNYDVMISHPQLVSTGLDLFSKQEGGHNYSTLVFYETGYNLFTMRQAARRAWRISQPKDCRVYYLYYKGTMQHKAMSLMSRKMAAAQALEGEFSEEGLAAMAGEDNLQMALAKNLSERIDDADMQRSWTKVTSGPKKPRKVTAPVNPSRVPWPMPRISDLKELSEAQKAAFNRLAAEPANLMTIDQMRCITATADALVNLGLAENTCGGYRCKLSAEQLADTLTWLKLYPYGVGIYLPLGIVVANHPEKGDHYVKVVNHQALSKGIEFVPVTGFPHGNSIPYCITQERQLAPWTLRSASAADRRALADAGFVRLAETLPTPSPLDDLPIEVQMIAEGLIESTARSLEPTAGVSTKVRTGKRARPQKTKLKMVSIDEGGDDIDIPELTPEIMAKMFANMMDHGLMESIAG